jgi:hypothetical protein
MADSKDQKPPQIDVPKPPPDIPEDTQVKVKTTAPPIRTLFEGRLADAKTYVERNFPRVHVNPQNPADEPQPDVSIQGETGGGEMFYWGPEEGWETA